MIRIIKSDALYDRYSQSWECSATVITEQVFERNIDFVKAVSSQLGLDDNIFHLGVEHIKSHEFGESYKLEWEVE